MIRRSAVFAFCVIAAIAAGFQCRAEAKKTYKVLMPSTYNISGKSKNQMMTFTEQIVDVISDIVDADITLQISPYSEEQYIKDAMTKLMKKEVDFVGFSGDWYGKFNENSRKKFPIFFGIEFEKKKDSKYCMYVRKSDNIKTVEQLRGKKLGGWIFKDTRYLLYKAGINEPLQKFFGGFVYKTSPFAVFMEDLVEKRIDTFSSWEFNVKTSLGNDPRFADITSVGCDYYALNPFVLYRGDIDPELIKKAQSAIFNWKKDKRFKSVSGLLYAINGGVVPFTEADMKHTLEIEELVQKGKWEDERKALIDKYGK